MKFSLPFTLCLLIAACGPAAPPSVDPSLPSPAGLEFLPRKAEKGTLFSYYQERDLSKWRNNWAGSLDLTGVSWNDPRTATLIDPSFVVMAAHFPRPSNVAVMFHDKKGKPYERYITAVRKLPMADATVGKLNLPLPPEVKPYRLARPSEATVGRPVIITDQTKTLSVHQIGGVNGTIVFFRHIPGIDSIYQRNLIVGDSGNPSFLWTGNELVLLGTHTTGGAGAGPFYGDPSVQAAIRSTMADMGN